MLSQQGGPTEGKLEAGAIPSNPEMLAFQKCQKEALAGDPKAQYALAWRYENGLGTKADLKAAFEWYEKAAKQNYIPACVNLVHFCLNGMTDQTARWGEWYPSAVNEAGFQKLKSQPSQDKKEDEVLAAAAFGLFLHYSRKDVQAPDPKTKPEYYLKLSAENGYPRALVQLAIEQIKAGHVVDALVPIQKALAKGYAQAEQYFQYVLSYLNALGTEEDFAKASSVDQTGLVNLCIATIYRTGNDRIKQDPAKAFTHYQLSAKNNNLDAIVALGECYEYGLGVKQDLNQAKAHYQKAADKGHPVAKARLGFSFDSALEYDAIKFKEAIFSGSFSDVSRASYNGTEVAVKKPSFTEYGIEALKREALLMQKMKHKHLVEFVGVTRNPLYLITKFALYGSLWKEVDENADLTFGDVINIADQIAQGIAYMHKCDLIHGDIKGSNILLDNPSFSLPDSALPPQKEVKIADFGSTQTCKDNERVRSLSEALPWMSPILLATGFANKASDMWAFAMVLVELVTRQGPLAECKNDDEIREKISGMIKNKEKRPVLPKECPKPLSDYIYSFFVDGKERPTAEQALERLQKLKDLPENKQKVPPKQTI